MSPAPYSSTEYAVKAAPASRLIEDGDTSDLGDRHLEVIHTPGHSPGGIMLWESASGILFSGDTVYDDPLIDDAYHDALVLVEQDRVRVGATGIDAEQQWHGSGPCRRAPVAPSKGFPKAPGLWWD